MVVHRIVCISRIVSHWKMELDVSFASLCDLRILTLLLTTYHHLCKFKRFKMLEWIKLKIDRKLNYVSPRIICSPRIIPNSDSFLASNFKVTSCMYSSYLFELVILFNMDPVTLLFLLSWIVLLFNTTNWMISFLFILILFCLKLLSLTFFSDIFFCHIVKIDCRLLIFWSIRDVWMLSSCS